MTQSCILRDELSKKRTGSFETIKSILESVLEENKTANYVHESRITLVFMCVRNFDDGSAATKICNKVTTDDR